MYRETLETFEGSGNRWTQLLSLFIGTRLNIELTRNDNSILKGRAAEMQPFSTLTGRLTW